MPETVSVISNKEIFEKMIERDLNNMISQVDGFFNNFSNSVKNINPQAGTIATLAEPFVVPKYKEYRNKYLPVIVQYVDFSIDKSFPDGVETTIEAGSKVFNQEMAKYIAPLIDSQIDKLNIPPMAMEILGGIMQGIQQSYPQYFK